MTEALAQKAAPPPPLVALTEDEVLFCDNIRRFAEEKIRPLVREMDEKGVFERSLIDQRALEDALFIHLAHQRTDFFLSEPADVVAEQDFIFGQRDQRRRRCGFLGEGFGHNAFLDASLSAWE